MSKMQYLSKIIDAKGPRFFSESERELISEAINAGPGDGPCCEAANFRYFAIEHAIEQLKSCAPRWKKPYAQRAYALIEKIESAQ
jgi:hypothetical protein